MCWCFQERGIVISWVDKLCENHELIRSSWEIKRRLLEMMIHSCTSDLKEAGKYFYTYVLYVCNVLWHCSIVTDTVHTVFLCVSCHTELFTSFIVYKKFYIFYLSENDQFILNHVIHVYFHVIHVYFHFPCKECCHMAFLKLEITSIVVSRVSMSELNTWLTDTNKVFLPLPLLKLVCSSSVYLFTISLL